MRKNKGFTLIELMVVILIVAILAAVLAPMLTGRIREAKWSEGRAGAGTVATALRAYFAETGRTTTAVPSWDDLGITTGDLTGKYFRQTSYVISSVSYTASTGAVAYTITVTAPGCVQSGGVTKTLNAAGAWSDGR